MDGATIAVPDGAKDIECPICLHDWAILATWPDNGKTEIRCPECKGVSPLLDTIKKHLPGATKTVVCGFEVVADTREQKPYTFDGIIDGPPSKPRKLIVPVRRETMATGDYCVHGFPRGIIERKSKADLYSSISQERENFVGRLEKMCVSYDFAAIVVEAEWSELLTDPPPFTKYNPKSLSRTILAWMTRYTLVQWFMAPSRRHAELFTFRLLQRYWMDQKKDPLACRGKVETLRRWDAELVKEEQAEETPPAA